jgi:hypothetical protein
MDHWSILASGTAERFTPIPPAEYYGEPDTFQFELIAQDYRAIRIYGDRSFLKHTPQYLATDRDIRRLGIEIERIMSEVTGAFFSLYGSAFGSGRISDEEAAEAGTFWLELRTHDDRAIRIEGDRMLFEHGRERLATERDIRQIGEQLLSAINSVTGEIERGDAAQA